MNNTEENIQFFENFDTKNLFKLIQPFKIDSVPKIINCRERTSDCLVSLTYAKIKYLPTKFINEKVIDLDLFFK